LQGALSAELWICIQQLRGINERLTAAIERLGVTQARLKAR
jgi:hypothetical protein